MARIKVSDLVRSRGPYCEYCGRRYPLRYLTRDHIVPRAKGGRDVRSNLRIACRACNIAKADRVFASHLDPYTIYQILLALGHPHDPDHPHHRRWWVGPPQYRMLSGNR